MCAKLSVAPCRKQRWALKLCLAWRLLPPLCSDPSQQFLALGLSSLGHLSHFSQPKVFTSILTVLADSRCSQNRLQNLELTRLLPWIPPTATLSFLLFPISVVISDISSTIPSDRIACLSISTWFHPPPPLPLAHVNLLSVMVCWLPLLYMALSLLQTQAFPPQSTIALAPNCALARGRHQTHVSTSIPGYIHFVIWIAHDFWLNTNFSPSSKRTTAINHM